MTSTYRHATYDIYIRSQWTDAWLSYTRVVYPESFEVTAAPDYGRALLKSYFGNIKYEDEAAYNYVPPLSLVNAQIRIDLYDNGVFTPAVFMGIITDQSNTLLNDVIVSGSSAIVAREIAYAFDRIVINSAIVVRNGSLYNVDRVYSFNERSEMGNNLCGNRSASPVGGLYRFEQVPGTASNYKWTARQAVEYLIQTFKPAGWTFAAVGQFSALDNVVDSWSVDGLSLWDALSVIINKRYGFGFNLRYDINNIIVLDVWTTTGTPITVGTSTIPANYKQTVFTIPSSFPQNHIMKELAIRSTNTTSYSQIVVRGGYTKCTGTFSLANGSLVRGWTTTQQNTYRSPGGSDADENDIRRSRESLAGVWTRFVVPQTWSGSLSRYDGGGLSSPLMLQHFLDARPNNASVGPFSFLGKRFERQTPFKVGYSYTSSPPVKQDDANALDEYQPTMAWIRDSFDGENHAKTNKFIPIDRISEHIPEAGVSLSVSPLSKQMGFQINCSPRHILAGNNWAGAADSNRDPEFSFSELLFTATVQHDQRIKAAATIAGGPAGHTLTIDASDLECWYVHPSTVVDIDQAGNPQTYVGPSLIRDDYPELQSILAAAVAWHGQIRQAIEIPLDQVGNFVGIGAFLVGVTGQTLSFPMRSPVTAIRVDCAKNQMAVETGWASSDFGPDFGYVGRLRTGKRVRR